MTNSSTSHAFQVTGKAQEIEVMAAHLRAKGYTVDLTAIMWPLRITDPTRLGLAGIRFEEGRWRYLLVFDEIFHPGEKYEIEQVIKEAIALVRNQSNAN